MKHFKKIGLALLTFVFFYSAISCSKEKNINDQDNNGYGFYPNTGMQIRIEDKDGNDLLDRKVGSSLTEEDIDRIIYVGNKNRAEVYFNSMLQAPKGFSIDKDEKSYYLSLGVFITDYNNKFTTNFLRIGKQGKVHEIKAEIEHATPATKDTYGGGVVSLKKVWLDGQLVWEGKDLLPIERNPVITIIVPKVN